LSEKPILWGISPRGQGEFHYLEGIVHPGLPVLHVRISAAHILSVPSLPVHCALFIIKYHATKGEDSRASHFC
ncbi:MAG: hypothetical protein WAJ96_17210, partial [Candidatus Acidiferrum sp.]